MSILWDVARGGERARLEGQGGVGVLSVAWSPDGRTLALGYSNGSVRLWDASSDSKRASVPLAVLRNEVPSVAWSPDGRTLAWGSSFGSIHLWDLASGAAKAHLKGHAGVVASLAWSPDGKTLASGSSDRSVRLWDATRRTESVRFDGHEDAVASVAWSPDGETLASGCKDGSIRLWAPAELEERRRLLLAKEKIVLGQWMRRYLYRVQGTELQPRPQTQLASAQRQPTGWSENHHLHWRARAEEGDADAMLKLADIYSRGGDFARAKHWYGRASDSGLGIAAERLALVERQEVLRQRDGLLAAAREHVREGRPEEALAAFQQAPDVPGAGVADPELLNDLCWLGSLANDAQEVLEYCEELVDQYAENAHYRDSRGLARALTGDLAGAAADFRYYVERFGDSGGKKVQRRRVWIKELDAGRNPFDEEELDALRRQ
jgi:hypothetical protein